MIEGQTSELRRRVALIVSHKGDTTLWWQVLFHDRIDMIQIEFFGTICRSRHTRYLLRVDST